MRISYRTFPNQLFRPAVVLASFIYIYFLVSVRREKLNFQAVKMLT